MGGLIELLIITAVGPFQRSLLLKLSGDFPFTPDRQKTPLTLH